MGIGNSLADSKWKKLLLYQRNDGNSSLIKGDSKFFLSKNGFSNSESEFQETLKIFLNPEEFLKFGVGHPQCVFPARLAYLARVRKIFIPKVSCPALTEWKSRLKGQEVSVIYATQFVSNPASVMGHTFLKFKDPKVENFLNVTVGYAAEVKMDDNPFEYAFKGLTGKYRGRVYENPFYEKVHEYNNMEQRDIWEYDLALTDEQTDQLLNLLWELKFRGDFSYYFLDENCSYMIMAFLEAIAPETDLTEGYGIFAAPYMTLIKLEKAGLIKRAKFRPSIRSQLVQLYESLSHKEKRQVLADIKAEKVREEKSSLYYETLITSSLYEKHKYEGRLSAVRRDFLNKAMIARSFQESSPMKEITPPSSPLDAHRPRFISAGTGNLSEGSYHFIELRPGIHGMNDPSAGFLPHSSFSFLESNIRYFPEKYRIELARLLLLDLQNTNLLHPIDPKLSWKLNLLFRERELMIREGGIYEGQFSIGGAVRTFGLDLIFLQGLKEQVSHEFEHGHVTWLKTDLQFRKESAGYLFDFSPSLSKAIVNGPKELRLDTTFELRFRFPKHHIQVGPRLNYQRLLNGKKSYFDHYLNVIYDF